jgi:hypothetical protein
VEASGAEKLRHAQRLIEPLSIIQNLYLFTVVWEQWAVPDSEPEDTEEEDIKETLCCLS